MTTIKKFLELIHKETIKNRQYYTFGYQADYRKKENYDYGYIPFVNGLEFFEKEEIIPKTNPRNRCGEIREYTEFITVHDTASGAPSANARAHANWINSMANDINSTTTVSWHFTVDEEGIIQHLPVDEVGYHAGDGTSVKLSYVDTKIPAGRGKCKVTISKDGYFVINKNKTDILVPKTDKDKIVKNNQLPYQGINVKISKDGTYLLGNTYWNSGYGVLSNKGGNLNSVGIETCVNYGADYIKTMRITAYLVAKLLIRYDLGIERVKQHNFFSGKDCPMTIRHAGMWEEFIDLVKLNLIYLKELKEYQIKFVSLTPEYLDNSGKVIKHKDDMIIKYKVIVTKGNKTKEYEFESKLEKITF
ncbi:MAG: N-acetylmuramoyl-L-alanine amidase [Bacilli bacterium]|nr:N-acetylmuramoyl-L-alanine amidase [Bacilli bacterium]